jgi:lipid-A-disaccharide synthase
MKYYLIAGEASGDMHASNLIRALKKHDPEAEFRCFGGDMMKDAGATLFIHYKEMAIMGGIEVLRKYPVIRKNKRLCRKDILAYRPDVLILVDYSGFNLPMARFAHRSNIRVLYYISPKLWAWAKWRVKTVQKCVEKMFVLLPFEVDFYKTHHVDAVYYGNPVLDSIEAYERKAGKETYFRTRNNLNDKPIIALLAGSRKQEIKHLLPEMLTVVRHYPGHQFVVAGAPALSPGFYDPFLKGTGVRIVLNQTYDLLRASIAAIVTSGTATLETALLGIPEVVVYKTSPITFFIGNFFVRVKYFSLVNLILNKEAVLELLQHNLAKDIKTALDRLLFDGAYRTEMIRNMEVLRKMMGKAGVADKVAAGMVNLLKGHDLG